MGDKEELLLQVGGVREGSVGGDPHPLSTGSGLKRELGMWDLVLIGSGPRIHSDTYARDVCACARVRSRAWSVWARR